MYIIPITGCISNVTINPSVTAGLKCPPDTGPSAAARAAKTKAWVRATPTRPPAGAPVMSAVPLEAMIAKQKEKRPYVLRHTSPQ